jgi:hypothetical protein
MNEYVISTLASLHCRLTHLTLPSVFQIHVSRYSGCLMLLATVMLRKG